MVLTFLSPQRHNSRLTGRMDFIGSADVFCTGVEPREPWWRRRSSAGFDLGLVPAVVVFIVTLCLYPPVWGESWRTVIALAVAAAVEVTLCLDATWNIYTS